MQQSLQSQDRIFISGTGRAGTSLLIKILTRLGLDTGFSPDGLGYSSATARAGLERNIFRLDGPRIVKSPFLCDQVDAVLRAGVRIRHIIIPIRDFEQAARSRAYVQKETTGSTDGSTVVNGGLWDTDRAEDQVKVLRDKFATLVEAAVRNDIPMSFLAFPRFARDPVYLHSKLAFMLPGIDAVQVQDAMALEVNPSLIHEFHHEISRGY